jgi:RimJ/RimL family protein N-acetyltransferase
MTEWLSRAGDARELLEAFAPYLWPHLAAEAVFAGAAAGRVWVDAPDEPQVALIAVGHRLYLLGRPEAASTEALGAWFEGYRERALARGQMGFFGAYAPDDWGPVLAQTLADWELVALVRDYYARELAPVAEAPSWPAGYGLRHVNAGLLAENWAGLGALEEEMCSERPSVADFLDRSFGLAVVHEPSRTLIGWCLSEYNHDGRCEVGIGIHEEHRRQGLGTAVARAFVTQAAARGITEIGWHCAAENVASAATARRTGFTHRTRYPACFAHFESGTHA